MALRRLTQCCLTQSWRSKTLLLSARVTTRWLSSPATGYAAESSAIGFENYEAERSTYNLSIPEYFNFSTDVIDKWAQEEVEGNGSKNPAFWWVDDHGNELKWSFKALSEYSQRAANALQGPCGLQPGDRVFAILPKIPQWWFVVLGCIRIGAVLIPGTTEMTASDIRERLMASKAKVIIADTPTTDHVDQIIQDCHDIRAQVHVPSQVPIWTESGHSLSWYNFNHMLEAAKPVHKAFNTKGADPMTIFFTSGTTGKAKMVEHNHAYGLAHEITARFMLDLDRNDIHWNISDPGWAKAAWSNLFAPWLAGCCVFVHHYEVFNARRALQVLGQFPITTMCAAPTVLRSTLGYKKQLEQLRHSNLRHITSVGEPLNPEVIHMWYDHTGLQIREGYGQTETVTQVASSRCLPLKIGSMGKAVPGLEVKIIKEDNSECSVGEEGDVAIKVKPDRPIGLFTRYVDNPKATDACYRGDWYITGDRGHYDEDGYFWFLFRNSDVITSSGQRIGPFDTENALLEHDAVFESAVVSTPDMRAGEVVKAFIVLTKDFTNVNREHLIDELKQHCKKHLEPIKCPRKIEFVDSLPKTVSGKIRRVQLRNQEWGEYDKYSAE